MDILPNTSVSVCQATGTKKLGHEGGCWLTETGHVSQKTATGCLYRGTGRIQGTEMFTDKLHDGSNRVLWAEDSC
jgi:hypothetical protein